MRRLLLFVCIVASVFVAMPLRSLSTEGVSNKPLGREVSTVLKTLTVYNPTQNQCDNSPFITASNKRIDKDKLYRQEIKWMAVSRDLLKRWKGEFNYGDTVILTAGDKAIDGQWVIYDNMNKRYKKRGDLLFDSRVRTLGKWKDVKIAKRVPYKNLQVN